MHSSHSTSFVFFVPIMVLTMALVSFTPAVSRAQARTLQLSGDQDVFMLKELGAVIADSENGPTVLMVIPSENRAEACREVDLREGDAILMANGKKISGARRLKEIYEGLNIGDVLKLGIKRGKEMLIASLAKADPDDLPAQIMMLKGGEESGDVATVMAGVGLILKETDGKVIIDEVLPGVDDKFTGDVPKKGDVILKIQETSITQPGQVPEVYSKLKANDQVRLTIDRQGTEITFSFAKQECIGNKPLIIKK